MIQRIQTVFLFAALALVVSLFFTAFTVFSTSTDIYYLSFKGISSLKAIPAGTFVQPVWISFSGALVSLLILIVIFLYKNRKLQMRLCLLSILLLLALNASMYFLSDTFAKVLATDPMFRLTFVFPVIAVVLIILAYRSINKDEQLVRSLDRLR